MQGRVDVFVPRTNARARVQEYREERAGLPEGPHTAEEFDNFVLGLMLEMTVRGPLEDIQFLQRTCSPEAWAHYCDPTGYDDNHHGPLNVAILYKRPDVLRFLVTCPHVIVTAMDLRVAVTHGLAVTLPLWGAATPEVRAEAKREMREDWAAYAGMFARHSCAVM
jgi:hypothetical protein